MQYEEVRYTASLYTREEPAVDERGYNVRTTVQLGAKRRRCPWPIQQYVTSSAVAYKTLPLFALRFARDRRRRLIAFSPQRLAGASPSGIRISPFLTYPPAL